MAVSRLSQTTLQNAFQKYNNLWDGLSAVGSMDYIGGYTLGAATSSVTFSSIPSTYQHLQVRVSGRSNRGIFRDFIDMNFNNDFASNYVYHGIQGEGSSATSFSATSQSAIQILGIAADGANNANGSGTCVIDILDYANTSKNTTVRGLCGYDDNGQGVVLLQSGLWRNTSAINRIEITPGIGTSLSQHTSIALYGIK